MSGFHLRTRNVQLMTCALITALSLQTARSSRSSDLDDICRIHRQDWFNTQYAGITENDFDQDAKEYWWEKRCVDEEAEVQAAEGCERREYRTLTAAERQAFHDCLNTMKSNGLYDEWCAMHRPSVSPCAHFGCAFIGFHRTFLLTLERTCGVCLPYWDSSLDNELSDQSRSSIWSDDCMGNSNGRIVTGPAANWRASVGGCDLNGDGYVHREFGGPCNMLYTVDEINQAPTFPDYVSPYQRSSDTSDLESYHGGPHMCVGGHMSNIVCSCLDPMFIMHHAFVDCQWEWWRQMHPEGVNQYPSDCSGCHSSNSPIFPFRNLVNSDALDDSKLRKTYTCAPSPGMISCTDDSDCQAGDRGLYCDGGSCTPTLKPGSRCTSSRQCRCNGGTSGTCSSRGTCRC